MGTVRGGDIRQLKIKGREFEPAPEAALEFMAAGFTNEHKVSGNGVMSAIQKRNLGTVDGMEVIIDNSRGDFEYLADLQKNGNAFPFTANLADGTTWSGTMAIEGELKYKTDTGTAYFGLKGQRLEQI